MYGNQIELLLNEVQRSVKQREIEKKIYGNKYYSCWPLARLLADAFTDLPDDTVSADRRVIRGLVYRHRPLLVSPYLVVWRRSLVAGITWWLTIYLCCAQRNLRRDGARENCSLSLMMRMQQRVSASA